MREVVEDGQTGLLVPSGDHAALAQRVLQVLDNTPLARQMGQRGRARAQALFSESRMHARYLQLYHEMLQQ
jgi:glycosyltransferase involved in cell wall biosynthesis